MSEGSVVEVCDALRRRGETVAVAESLTGGLLAATLVAIPGATDIFRGGIVAYATDLKASMLGVDQVLLRRLGPVSREVAIAMATGVRRVCRSDWGLSTTGVAGPGSSGGHPAGACVVGLAGPGQQLAVELRLAGDRAQVRQGVVLNALQILLKATEGTSIGHLAD